MPPGFTRLENSEEGSTIETNLLGDTATPWRAFRSGENARPFRHLGLGLRPRLNVQIEIQPTIDG